MPCHQADCRCLCWPCHRHRRPAARPAPSCHHLPYCCSMPTLPFYLKTQPHKWRGVAKTRMHFTGATPAAAPTQGHSCQVRLPRACAAHQPSTSTGNCSPQHQALPAPVQAKAHRVAIPQSCTLGAPRCCSQQRRRTPPPPPPAPHRAPRAPRPARRCPGRRRPSCTPRRTKRQPHAAGSRLPRSGPVRRREAPAAATAHCPARRLALLRLRYRPPGAGSRTSSSP
jgi:hypothetical protein